MPSIVGSGEIHVTYSMSHEPLLFYKGLTLAPHQIEAPYLDNNLFSPCCRFGRVQSVKLLSGGGHDGDSATVAFMDITSACKVI